MRKFLHVGCGPLRQSSILGFKSPDLWQEVRLDIDPSVDPDVIGTITDMSAVDSKSMDAVFSAHNIEHVYPFEVRLALGEFYRVLAADGFLVVTCPDLKAVCKALNDIELTDVLYSSTAGPIRPLDVFYGHQASVEAGNHFMAHKGGFSEKTLRGALGEAGFEASTCRSTGFALWAIASKNPRAEEDLQAMAEKYFPR